MTATELREFPTAVIASISSGILLCEFSKMHEAAEFLMGHPIWTHHFSDPELNAAMKRGVGVQCPGMPSKIEGVTKDNYLAKVAEIEAELGPTQRIRKGGGRGTPRGAYCHSRTTKATCTSIYSAPGTGLNRVSTHWSGGRSAGRCPLASPWITATGCGISLT